ncbi:uncharacterized protein L201_006716 [Kwoniella dendrophila CBS 6074]|uniref:F-box domain-containing protein n=1 Tax=Kwoniella dendrophila CBS 6074 TaxID=1295534 RepID=A0AAX4K318_9TREE
MVSLLDLEDDNIRLISQYTNRDTYIPLPSYGPHWQNFKSDINSKVARDLLAFRSTCKRIHNSSRLEGLHIDATQWSKVLKWMCNAPREAEKGVRRIKLSIPPNMDSNSVMMYSTLTTFLSRFDNLEELIICNSTMNSCYHRPQGMEFDGPNSTSNSNGSKEFRLPLYSFLPKLTSFSVEIICPICAEQVPKVLVPAMKNLEHLKFSLFGLPDLNVLGPGPWSDSLDPFLKIQNLTDNWSKYNGEDGMKLKTLYLRYSPKPENDTPDQFKSIIRRICDALPNLEELKITRFEIPIREDLRCGIKLNGQLIQGEWHFESGKSEGEGDSKQSLQDLLLSLGLSPSIRILDPVLLIEIPEKRPTYSIPSNTETFSSFLLSNQLSTSCETQRDLTGNYEVKLKEAMKVAAQIMINTVPSLEEGTFWEKGTELSKKDWYLWKWHKIIVNGVSIPKLRESPYMMSREFVSSQTFNKLQAPRMVGMGSGAYAGMAVGFGMGMDMETDMQIDEDGDDEDVENEEDDEDGDDALELDEAGWEGWNM